MFKAYSTSQILLLPPSLSDLIPANDPSRVVNSIVEGISIKDLHASYKKLGSHSYHPKLMVKCILFAYMSNIYSSRKIEQLIKTDVRFMWLAGMQHPDHNTINRFRIGRLGNGLKEIFKQVVVLMQEEGFLTLRDAYIDGTKIEAQANRYTFVWGKNVQNRKVKIADAINALWEYTTTLNQEEQGLELLLPEDINQEKVKETIRLIEDKLQGKPADKKVVQQLKYGKKNWPKQLENNKEQAELLGERSSYSKTDPDATFMRMKEDHMLNGQLKPAYNVQLSTEKQIITSYTIHQTAGDSTTLIPHLESFRDLYGFVPTTITADAGYGSEENYLYTEAQGAISFIKYNNFHREQKKNYQQDPYSSANFFYNQDKDVAYCPMGQPMARIGQKRNRTKNGFEQTVTLYQALRCDGCPLRGGCHKGKGERIIQINHRLKALRERERLKLLSEEGRKHRSQRPADVEAVFGNLKHNKGFNRFMLRGLPKVEVEFGLLAIAHNLAKMCA